MKVLVSYVCERKEKHEHENVRLFYHYIQYITLSGCPWYLNNIREKSQGYLFVHTTYQLNIPTYLRRTGFFFFFSGFWKRKQDKHTRHLTSRWKWKIFYYTHTGCHGTCWMCLRVISTDVSRRYTMPWRKKKMKSFIGKLYYGFRYTFSLCVQYCIEVYTTWKCRINIAVLSAITLNGKRVFHSFDLRKVFILHSHIQLSVHF